MRRHVLLLLFLAALPVRGSDDPMTDPVYLRIKDVRARGWHPISVNGDATMEKHSTWFTLVSVRPDRIEAREKNSYRIWLRWDAWPEPKSEPIYTHVVERVEVNCASLQFRRLDSTSYNGPTPVATSEAEEKWSESVPGSINEDVFQTACEFAKERQK